MTRRSFFRTCLAAAAAMVLPAANVIADEEVIYFCGKERMWAVVRGRVLFADLDNPPFWHRAR